MLWVGRKKEIERRKQDYTENCQRFGLGESQSEELGKAFWEKQDN